MLKMKIWAHNHHMNFQCIICSARSEMHGASCSLFHDNRVVGDVCVACLQQGQQKAQAAVQETIQCLEAELDSLKKIAESLPHVQWQHPAIVRFAQQEAEALAQGGEWVDCEGEPQEQAA